MKKLLFMLLLVCGSVVATSGPFSDRSYIVAPTPCADSVILCNSSTAYAYHSSSYCRGLNRCTHTLIKVSMTNAVKKYGRTPCKICY